MQSLPPVYPIVDVDLCRMRGVDPRALASACLSGGARLLQVRQKAPGSGAFVTLTRHIIEEAAASDALIIVNDRADVAVIADAGGVHVGEQDLEVDAVRTIVGPDRLIGLSTHTHAQIDRALAGAADYVAVGPVFHTSTKETGYEPRGLEMVRYAAGRGKPVVAIGGITLENARQVMAAGATSVAVISDLLIEADVTARIERYVMAVEP